MKWSLLALPHILLHHIMQKPPNSEHLVLVNNFAITKKFLITITKFECITYFYQLALQIYKIEADLEYAIDELKSPKLYSAT